MRPRTYVYQPGDVLLLREYEPDADAYTGRHVLARVTHIFREHAGVAAGYVLMSIYRFREPRSI